MAAPTPAEFVPYSFDVLGLSAPQGSKSKMPNGVYLEGRDAAQRERHKSWRTAVAEAARDAAAQVRADLTEQVPLIGPLEVWIDFRFPVPAARRRKCERAGGTLPKTSSPDLDKIERSTYDGLKAGGLIIDDAVICANRNRKLEVIGWTGARITVRRWEP